MLSKKERAARDNVLAYTWVARMMTREQAEFKHLLKYGTPSDRLIGLAEVKIMMRVHGKLRNVTFPFSLNSAKGQKKVYQIAKKVEEFNKYFPNLAYSKYVQISRDVKHRRSDTQRNIHMVAEALLNRAAHESKPEIIFAFDSILTWIKSVYNKDLGYLTIRRCLEFLQAEGHLEVREWGRRGIRTRATRIKLNLDAKKYNFEFTVECDMWLELSMKAMDEVYSRESITRQDVLEAKFHHFIDTVAAQAVADSRYAQGARLFPAKDAKIAVLEPVMATATKKEITDETYFDRLLGGLVFTLQEDGSDAGASPDRIQRYRTEESRCGSG